MPKLISGAEIVFKALEDQKVEYIFGYPGGAVLPIYDELKNHKSIKHILARHEQGAGHAAEGYARSSGKPGVLLVTSGPGATNAVTALTDAYMDSVPLVCISGQVPTHLIGTDAFQECDTTGITRPCTKHNWLVKDVNDLSRVLHLAFEVATTGRPGPVLVDIPKDIQFKKGKYKFTKNSLKKKLNGKATHKLSNKELDTFIDLMKKSSKPIFYTGGGVINSGPDASKYLRELVSLTGFPITSTLQGLGAYPGDDPQFLGMLGMHGTFEANNAMHDCDLMINIGARFDDRITGKVDEFSPKSKKIHVDIDPSSIGKNIKVDLAVVSDVSELLKNLINSSISFWENLLWDLLFNFFSVFGFVYFALANWISFGISINTGPGLPVVATLKASCIIFERSLTSFTNQLCLVHGLVIPVVSHSWNASVPIKWVGTWPDIQTSGTESI